MIQTMMLFVSVLFIIFCAVRFCVAYFRDDANHLKWIIPIPVIALSYLMFLVIMFQWA